MVPDLNRRFPVRIRPRYLEAPESYGQRLALANGLPALASSKAARQLAASSEAQALRAALVRWCEAKGGLAPGHFQRQARQVREELPARSMCRLCAGGATVGQLDHVETNCCLRHGLWTGPGTTPAAQFTVGREVIAAERRYRYLLRRNRADLSLFRAIASVLTPKNYGAPAQRIFDAGSYPVLIAVAGLLTDRSLHRKLFDTRLTFAETNARLAEHLRKAVPGSGCELADGVWLLLRPTFLWVRKSALDAPTGEDFVPLIAVNRADIQGADSTVRPLEPFSRYLAQLRQQRGALPVHRREVYVVAGQGKGRGPVPTVGRPLLICGDGHVLRRGWDKAFAALDEGRSMCPICNGGQPLAGYNTIVETHPHLAREWDAERNDNDCPLIGSRLAVQWLCDS
ncbi:hypothetical protein ACQ3I4_16525 [Zafaria sp. Z1313]|uniref:hypothetical protein n=1 Tax=Zafaria sp. Z1313 TaxID=3423202 RepID=UPI003D301A2B